MSGITIHQHLPGKNIDDFLRVPHLLFARDPQWVAPLNLMLKDQFSPKSPFFEHADVMLFTARRNGELVGRISAQIDREHLKRYNDDIGFFGFFDTVDDPEVGQELLKAAESWLKERGMQRMRGPMNLSVNQEVGTLVEGFDTPPMVMMPHSLPHQDAVALASGLEKAKDLYAWRWECEASMPKRCMKAHTAMRNDGVTFRSVNISKELPELVAVQDDAWRHNWAHVSMTEAEARQLQNELKLIIDPAIAIVCEVEGEIAGMALAIPNLNEAINDFEGKISPAKVAKLLWRLKVERPKSARVAMLGIKEHIRKQKRYMPLALALIAELNRRGYQRGYEWGELSWTLEDNGPVNAMIRSAGGKIYKKYRLYEKSLSSESN
ncbi:MAG: GNAT family N-acetyltransferase [Polyangiaceae bacterium]|nr:GNAT family N-acetyltransferase [Polyangiaceae bacterium]